MDGTPALRPIDGHLPRGGTTMETPGVFERDDLLTAERLRALRAAADQVRPVGVDAPRFIDRARRSLGAGLIAIGSAIAGAGRAAGNAASPGPCDDREVGAAA